MSDPSGLKAALDEILKRPCKCVSCPDCNGKGNIPVDMFSGRPLDYICDDFFELEPCDQCHGGIIELCERCGEAQELEEQINELEYRRA